MTKEYVINGAPEPARWPAGLAELVELGAVKGLFVYSDEGGGLFACAYRHSGPWFGVNGGHLPWEQACVMLRGALSALPDAEPGYAQLVRASAIKLGEKR